MLPSSRPTPATEAKYVLVVMSGTQIGERRAVDRELSVGRDPAAGLAIRDATVSWAHARLETVDGALVVHDLGSRHGTWVNGERLEGAVALREGDDLGIGTTQLRVELHGPAELLFDRAVAARLDRDDITGLMTRRKFDAGLEGQLEAADKEHRALSLVVLDLDGLKRVNDAHGHLCGAEVIRVVGDALHEWLPPDASGCRFGGDEFAVALPGLDEDSAAAFARVLLDRIAELPVVWEQSILRVTAAAGVACNGPAIGVPELFVAADHALLDAKRRGGNQVVRASERRSR